MITPKFYVWLKCAVIRAIKTVAQTMVATIGTSAVISDIDWKIVFSSSLVAGILSMLTSVATGLPEVEASEEIKHLKEARRLNAQNSEENNGD